MPDTGFLFADIGEGASAAGGNSAWLTHTGALVDDAVSAFVQETISDSYSHYLVVRDFDIAIPPSAIVGVEIEILHDLSVSGATFNGLAWLTKNGTDPVGSLMSIAPTSGEETDTYGGPTNLWGTTLTESEVEATTFGLIFQGAVSTGSITWAIDQVKLKVYYLEVDTVLPDADIVTTGWTSTPLFSKINDGSDATVIQATAS